MDYRFQIIGKYQIYFKEWKFQEDSHPFAKK